MTTFDPEIESRVVDLAAWSLPGARPLRSPVDADHANALVQRADAHRLLGPLAVAVQQGEVHLPDEALDLLAARHEAAMWWCLVLERRLLEVRALFEAAGGVDHLVIKGSAIAHLDEGDPSLRSFADLDLLVRAEHLERAVAVLAADGAERPWAERRPHYDRRFAKSVTLAGPDGVEFDLHRSLCDGAHGFRIPLDRLFADQVSFVLGGVEVGALSGTHRLLHAAYHAVLGSPAPKLMSLRDLGGYLTRDDLPIDEILAEVACWRGEAVLAVAVRETLDVLGVSAPAWRRWADEVEIPVGELVIVDRQRAEGSTPGRAKLDGLPELPWRDRVAYTFALTVPSRAHLRSRGLGPVDIYARRLRQRLPRRARPT